MIYGIVVLDLSIGNGRSFLCTTFSVCSFILSLNSCCSAHYSSIIVYNFLLRWFIFGICFLLHNSLCVFINDIIFLLHSRLFVFIIDFRICCCCFMNCNLLIFCWLCICVFSPQTVSRNLYSRRNFLNGWSLKCHR